MKRRARVGRGSGTSRTHATRRAPRGRARAPRIAVAASDPVTCEIIKGALRAAQAEMEAVIERTAMSPFIREKKG